MQGLILLSSVLQNLLNSLRNNNSRTGEGRKFKGSPAVQPSWPQYEVSRVNNRAERLLRCNCDIWLLHCQPHMVGFSQCHSRGSLFWLFFCFLLSLFSISPSTWVKRYHSTPSAWFSFLLAENKGEGFSCTTAEATQLKVFSAAKCSIAKEEPDRVLPQDSCRICQWKVVSGSSEKLRSLTYFASIDDNIRVHHVPNGFGHLLPFLAKSKAMNHQSPAGKILVTTKSQGKIHAKNRFLTRLFLSQSTQKPSVLVRLRLHPMNSTNHEYNLYI